MLRIEPCCAQRHFQNLRGKIKTDGSMFFHAAGDLSLSELLPVLLTRYSEVDATFVFPFLPDGGADAVLYWMRKTWARADGKGRINVIGHLHLITDLREKKSPKASSWLSENPFPGRLELHNVQQNDTAILLPDIAVYGNINIVYGNHFTALVTKNTSMIADLREEYCLKFIVHSS